MGFIHKKIIFTTIILIILSGIIILSFNNTKLFSKTTESADKYKVAKQDEQNTLNEYNSYFADNSRENTKVNYCKVPANSITESTASETNPCVVIETYRNETEWCRVWSDGWKEQGGTSLGGANSTGNVTTFLKSFTNANYTITTSDAISTHSNAASCAFVITKKNVNNFSVSSSWVGDTTWGYASLKYSWYACGY